MMFDGIYQSLRIIRNVFRFFIHRHSSEVFYTFTLYSNMIFIVSHGSMNSTWSIFYKTTKYFTKFFPEDWVRHDYR